VVARCNSAPHAGVGQPARRTRPPRTIYPPSRRQTANLRSTLAVRHVDWPQPGDADRASTKARKAAPMFDEKYLIVILVVALLFGASKLPMLGRNLGQGIKEFKNGIAEAAGEDDKDESEAKPSSDASA
jgi:sec-independent protein translocase protein TatA